MATSTSERVEPARRTGREVVALCALGLGVVAIAAAILPDFCRVAWVPAAVAVALGFGVLELGLRRKRYALVGILLGWFAFSYSFALMVWG
jgi:hypothetical protein